MLVEYDDLVLVCLCGGVMANFIWYIFSVYTLFPYGLYRASFDDLWESVVSCVCVFFFDFFPSYFFCFPFASLRALFPHFLSSFPFLPLFLFLFLPSFFSFLSFFFLFVSVSRPSYARSFACVSILLLGLLLHGRPPCYYSLYFFSDSLSSTVAVCLCLVLMLRYSLHDFYTIPPHLLSVKHTHMIPPAALAAH